MDYEKKYKEILEWARKNKARLNGVPIEDVLPEPAESEDEKIIDGFKGLLRSIKDRGGLTLNMVPIERCEAWLEKQKEPVVNRDGLYYYDGKKFTYCGYPATEENPYDFAMSQQENQKEQKPAEKPDLVANLKHHLSTTPKEQLQKEWDDLKEWGDVGPTVQEFLYGKPAEWSEEDEKILESLISLIETISEYYISLETRNGYVAWLKSLRPHWKPCEEQMKALYCAINDAISLYSDKGSPLYEEISRTHFDALDSLYHDLKKLM